MVFLSRYCLRQIFWNFDGKIEKLKEDWFFIFNLLIM